MARIRTIKPEFWTSESVGRLSREARLLFIGLWNQADDYGRFRAHPRLLAASLFPYDCDVVDRLPQWLAELEQEQHIQLYQVGRDTYGHVSNWSKHQKVDKPNASKLPEPPERTAHHTFANPLELVANVREESRAIRELSWEDQGPGTRDQGKEQGPETLSADADEPPAAALQKLWNETADPTLPRCKELSPERRRKAATRLRERGLSGWKDVILRLNKSSFCLGDNDSGWRATFDWLLKPGSAAKILEGTYDRATGPPRNGKSPVAAEAIDWNAPKPEGYVDPF